MFVGEILLCNGALCPETDFERPKTNTATTRRSRAIPASSPRSNLRESRAENRVIRRRIRFQKCGGADHYLSVAATGTTKERLRLFEREPRLGSSCTKPCDPRRGARFLFAPRLRSLRHHRPGGRRALLIFAQLLFEFLNSRLGLIGDYFQRISKVLFRGTIRF